MYRRSVESVLSFEYGFSIGPIGISVQAKLTGRLQLEELTCAEATSSSYCEFLDIFLSKEEVRSIHDSMLRAELYGSTGTIWHQNCTMSF